MHTCAQALHGGAQQQDSQERASRAPGPGCQMKTRLLRSQPATRPRAHTVHLRGHLSSPTPALAASLAGQALLGLVFLKPVTPQCCPHRGSARSCSGHIPARASGTSAPMSGASVQRGGCVRTQLLPARRRAMRITHRAFFSCLLGRFFMLYGAVGVKEGILLPRTRGRCPLLPVGPDNRQGGSHTRADGYLKAGWPARPPPLTSLPPHVSRPGWYPAPRGSWSRQLRHRLKHGLDAEELTSRELSVSAWRRTSGAGAAARLLSLPDTASVGNRPNGAPACRTPGSLAE